MKIENSREEAGEVLLAVRDKIVVVYSDFSVAASVRGFDAIGAACNEARGALQILNGSGGAQDAAKRALHAAEVLNAAVQGPFHFLRTRA